MEVTYTCAQVLPHIVIAMDSHQPVVLKDTTSQDTAPVRVRSTQDE